jgi:predicted DNA-binding transcriptional regulator YafY
MSWGDQVEVLEPPELREVVATAARGLAARYG